ncbi:aldose-1-epimerase, partial [Escherichia coli]|nr:aldose-1-epimerase [Escherichia coli]
WQISELTATSVTLTAFLPPSYGYPFMLASQVVYSLNAHTGLSVEIASQNIGTVTAPYGVGIHPYLTCNLTSVDEYLFQLPANQVYAVDEHANPTTLHHVDELDLNFTQAKKIAATKIDHTFKTANDLWEMTITHPQQALSVSLCSDQPWVQIYSGEKLQRQGLAVEPMSCPPNAFNSGIDLLLLESGKPHRLFFNIYGQRK